MYVFITAFLAGIFLIAFLALFAKSGYFNKILVKIGLKKPRRTTNWTAFSWESCLVKMNVKADVVFLGDSLIRGGDFHEQFPNLNVVNLGSSGDTLAGMVNRVSTVKALQPQKVFVMGGINGLSDYNVRLSIEIYKELIKELKNAVPEAKLYFLSVLPLSARKAKKICKNETIVLFNDEVRKIVEESQCAYVDIHSLYLKDGELNPSMTKEGLHLNPEGYAPWYDAIREYI